ncbi:MAG: DUF1834 family protein [Alphaproteobacteria bacterium]|nr:DUF1834 family protein [Alphaproteobacteria bacterium]
MIGNIEQAMIDAVKAVNGTDAGKLGYQILTIGSYGGEFASEEGISRAVRTFPAVLFVYLGEPKPVEGPNGGLWRRPSWAAFVAQDNRRNESSVRHGADGKVGSYQMAEDIAALFFRKDLGQAIQPIVPGAVRSIRNAGSVSIYSVELTTEFLWNPALADAAALNDFSTFHADWDMPPHGNVTAPLPAAEADASDTLTNLETS